MPLPDNEFNDNDLKIIHYNCFDKPWHYSGILYENHFWNLAKETSFYDHIINIKNNFSKADVDKDSQALVNLLNNAKRIAENDLSTFKIILNLNK